MIRRQLPVYSPLPLRAVVSGIGAALTGGRSARRAVRRSLEEWYFPDELLLTDSGTGALTLALRAVREEQPERPVALPAYSCYDVATAAVGAEVPVLFYDVEPRTLSPDLESLRDAVREGASAIVVAHLYGVPMAMEPVMELAEEAGIPVIEDAAQAAGGRYRGEPLGSFGDLSILSFGRGKGTTGCGGGALLASEDFSRQFLSWTQHRVSERRPRGWSRTSVALAQWLFGRPYLYTVPASLPFLELGETVYQEPEAPGRMSAASLGILQVTLTLEDCELDLRRHRAGRLRKLVESNSGVIPVASESGSNPGYLRFPVLAQTQSAARTLSDGYAESLGIMPGYPKPLSRLEVMKERCWDRAISRSGADELARRLFTIPTHSRLDANHDDRIAKFVGSLEVDQSFKVAAV